MKQSNQSGFAAIEAVLVVVIIAILGFTGWFVWNAKQNTDKSLNAANNSSQNFASKNAEKATSSKSPSETDNWLLFEAPGHEYTVRIADGWKVSHCKGMSYLLTLHHDDTTFRPGTKAVVTDLDCPKNAASDGFEMGFSGSTEYSTPDQPLSRTYKTNEGYTVNVYSWIEKNQIEDYDSLENGGTYYNYVITKSSTKNVNVEYGVNPGQVSDTATLEKVINTVVIK